MENEMERIETPTLLEVCLAVKKCDGNFFLLDELINIDNIEDSYVRTMIRCTIQSANTTLDHINRILKPASTIIKK